MTQDLAAAGWLFAAGPEDVVELLAVATMLLDCSVTAADDDFIVGDKGCRILSSSRRKPL